MSNPADNGGRPAREAIEELEDAVGEALDQLVRMTERAQAAEKTSDELNDLMRRVSGNPAEAGDLLTRLRDLEDENADLRSRLERGREGVERLLSKVRFLESQRS